MSKSVVQALMDAFRDKPEEDPSLGQVMNGGDSKGLGGVMEAIFDSVPKRGAGYPMIRRADDWLNDKLEYALGPQGYKALTGATSVAREVTPAADFRDMQQFSGDLMNAETALDAVEDAGWLGAASLGVLLPGSAAAAREGVRGLRGADVASAPYDMGGAVDAAARPSAISSVDGPAHTRPEWRGAAPSRTEPYPRYRPKNTTERMARLERSIADPDNAIRGVFDNYVEKGRELGGPDWYNTEELRDWFVEELGETAGDQQWREYMKLIGTTSTGAKVPQNIRMASMYRAIPGGADAGPMVGHNGGPPTPTPREQVAQMVKDEGITPAAAARILGLEPKNMPGNYNYGHIKQRNQAGNVLNLESGKWDTEVPEDLTGADRSKWLQANPKVKGFGNDLLGDDTNIAADMHFMRMLAMADGGGDFLGTQAKLSKADFERAAAIIGPKNIKKYTSTRMVNGKQVSEVNLAKAFADGRIKDTSGFQSMPTAWADTPKANEYAAYEDMAKRVAEEYDMTPAQFQASLWMGAGDMTGLADESQGTFMELFRRSLDKRAGERGLERREMLKDFIHNKAPLSIGGATIGAYALRDDEEQY